MQQISRLPKLLSCFAASAFGSYRVIKNLWHYRDLNRSLKR